MLTFLAAVAATTPSAVTSKIVTASLFKNGYSLVVRKLPMSGNSTTTADIPQSALGTFWITTTGDLKITELVATQEERSDTIKPGSFEEFLSYNIGKEVTIQTVNLGEQKGKLFNVQGDTIMLERAGMMIMMARGEVRMITVSGEGTTTSTRKHMERVLRFKTTGSGDVLLYGLERGMTWAPGYSIDLTSEKELTLTAKATVLNDLGNLDNTELQFVTGFPNVPWATLTEPLLSGQSVDQFTGFLSSIGASGPGGGGFGGGGRRDAMTQNAAPALERDFGEAFAINSGGGVQAEDLFFYSRPGITLKTGDRGFYILFQAKSDYEHLYTSEIPDGIQNNYQYTGIPDGPTDVWHSLKLKNNAGQPLTTAPVTVFKDGQILGQDTLMYTPKGSPLTVKMSKALDIRLDATEEEISRERGALRLPNGNVFDLVTLKGTIALRSFKDKDVAMKIEKVLTGEVTESTGTPNIVKLAKGLREVNPRSKLTWTPTMPAGKTMELTYRYKVYVQ